MYICIYTHKCLSLGDKNQTIMGDPGKGNGVAEWLEMVLGKWNEFIFHCIHFIPFEYVPCP